MFPLSPSSVIGYSESSHTVQLFWEVIKSFSNEQRLQLLQFVTGTSSIPFGGFRNLYGTNGPQLFTIQKITDYTLLPVSHTCFNRLDLPEYAQYATLHSKLKIAMMNSAGFDIE
eukprot:Awhi_evm1s13855